MYVLLLTTVKIFTYLYVGCWELCRLLNLLSHTQKLIIKVPIQAAEWNSYKRWMNFWNFRMIHSITDLLWERALIANVLSQQICGVSKRAGNVAKCQPLCLKAQRLRWDNVGADASAFVVFYTFLINRVHYKEQLKITEVPVYQKGCPISM